MNCPNCNASVRDGQKYCGVCGHSLKQSMKATRVHGAHIRDSFSGRTPSRRAQVTVEKRTDQINEPEILTEPIIPGNLVSASEWDTHRIDIGSEMQGTPPIVEKVALTQEGNASEIIGREITREESGRQPARSITSSRYQNNSIAQEENARQPLETNADTTPAIAKFQKYFSDTDLWTWLKKEDKRQLFYREEESQITAQSYMTRLKKQLNKNKVPASVTFKQFRWDASEIYTYSYCVQSTSAELNPLVCILQFAQVGKFYFVEQKTFVAPPNLPSHPTGKKQELPNNHDFIGLVGGACILCSLILGSSGPQNQGIGTLVVLMGIVMLVFSFGSASYRNQIKNSNEKYAKSVKDYESAWSDWEASVFITSFQEATNGEIVRIYQSVFECMRQVNAELFGGEATETEQNDTTMAELQAQITARKKSYR